MEKLFLIDAYAIIYRSYYAFINNPRINSKGQNTSAVIGFMNTLNEILTKEHPTLLAVAFDHGKTFRNEAFPEYKAQREATPEDIRWAVPVIKEILEAYKIPSYQVDGFEADDVIGTLATKAGKAGIDTYMLTPDKDYGQLVTENVCIYRPKHGGGYETLDETAICEKYGISTPLQVIDILALMGDSADNFPGCPGVGSKTATSLINQFGSIEEMLARTSEIKGKLREKVETATEDIKMSKFLATIRTDVPVELELEKMKVQDPDEEKLLPLFQDLEFKSFAERILKKTSPKKKTVNTEPDLFGFFTTEESEPDIFSSFESLNSVDHDYQVIDSEEGRGKLVDLILTKPFFSFSIETDVAAPIDAKITSMSFSLEPHKAFFIPLTQNQFEVQKIVSEFRPLFENEKIRKVGHNLKFIIEVLLNYDIQLKGELFDTMIAHYLLHPELSHDLDSLSESEDLLHYQLTDHKAEVADIALQLKEQLEPDLKDKDLWKLFTEVEMPLVYVLADMEHTGVCIDEKAMAETSAIFNQRADEIEKEIYSLAGHSFNIASPRQVGDVLFGEMQIVDKPKKTKTGQFVTSEEELQKLAPKNPIVQKILEYRGLKKLIGTYVDALPKLVNPRTGRIHTSFNQAVTATGRLSSSDPNLQNIPVRGEDGKEIRKCFIPEPGCKFFSADYSQIELRVIAHLSQDPHMLEAFRNNWDIHASTAANVYHKNREDVTRDERTKAKRANFGLIYGISAWGLSQSLMIERSEAKELMAGFFTTFPKVEEYMEKSKETVREREKKEGARKGYSLTIFNRRRYLPDISSTNATVRSFAERNAINAPIQGSAADIIKCSMVRIFRRFSEEKLHSKMILQVHDELNFSVYPEEEGRVEQIVLEEMQNAYPLTVPLLADSGWGDNWLEAH